MADPKNPTSKNPTARSETSPPAREASGGATNKGASASSKGAEESSSSTPRLVDRVKQSATTQLTSQKNRGIDAVGSVAQAVRFTGQKLRDEQHATIAGYVDNAASQIERWTETLKRKDTDELLRDLRRFAQRNPAAFIGSAFAVGVLGARFLKSSASSNDEQRSESRRWQTAPATAATAADRGSTAQGGARTSTTGDRSQAQTGPGQMSTATGEGRHA